MTIKIETSGDAIRVIVGDAIHTISDDDSKRIRAELEKAERDVLPHNLYGWCKLTAKLDQDATMRQIANALSSITGADSDKRLPDVPFCVHMLLRYRSDEGQTEHNCHAIDEVVRWLRGNPWCPVTYTIEPVERPASEASKLTEDSDSAAILSALIVDRMSGLDKPANS